MKRMFLEKFFPASRTIRKEICEIRFNKLCATCPHHQISEQLLIQYFYEGLTMMDQSMIDATSRGALMDKTPTTTRHLISNMASNTQQFGIREPTPNVWKATILARVESRAICNSMIRILPECTTKTNRLSTTDSTISSTTVLTTTTTTNENASSRQFTISRGPDEAISNQQLEVPANHELQQHAISAKYECHFPRPQDANRIAS
ncbi:hypothetical protein CR513_13587, partial [Mucuna pruriens]